MRGADCLQLCSRAWRIRQLCHPYSRNSNVPLGYSRRLSESLPFYCYPFVQPVNSRQMNGHWLQILMLSTHHRLSRFKLVN